MGSALQKACGNGGQLKSAEFTKRSLGQGAGGLVKPPIFPLSPLVPKAPVYGGAPPAFGAMSILRIAMLHFFRMAKEETEEEDEEPAGCEKESTDGSQPPPPPPPGPPALPPAAAC